MKLRILNSIVLVIMIIGIGSLPVHSETDRALKFQKLQVAGLRSMALKDYSEAIANFEAALKEHSNSWQTLQNMAICQTQLGQFDKAVSTLRKSIEIGGLHVTQCNIMASALEGLGESKKAIAWLNLACSIDPVQAANPVMQNKLKMLRDPQHCPPGAIDAPDYISSLASINKRGGQGLPLKVYVRKNIQLPEFYPTFFEIVKESLQQWCNATGNVLTYKFVNDKESANLVCDYTEYRELVTADHEPGLAGSSDNRISMPGNQMHWSNITILVKDAPGIRVYASPSLIKTRVLHEVGHALGMQGHSPNNNDIMFYASAPVPISTLSLRDINTIRKIYPLNPIKESVATKKK